MTDLDRWVAEQYDLDEDVTITKYITYILVESTSGEARVFSIWGDAEDDPED